MLRDGLCLLGGWQWPRALGRQGTEQQGLEMPAEGDGLAPCFCCCCPALSTSPELHFPRCWPPCPLKLSCAGLKMFWGFCKVQQCCQKHRITPPAGHLGEPKTSGAGLPYIPLCQGTHTPFAIRAPSPATTLGMGRFPCGVPGRAANLHKNTVLLCMVWRAPARPGAFKGLLK